MPGATPVGRARIPSPSPAGSSQDRGGGARPARTLRPNPYADAAMTPPLPPVPPVPPAFSRAWWQTFRVDAVRLFHAYANWLVSITWKRFFLLSLLLLILATILSNLPPFAGTRRDVVTIESTATPTPPTPPVRRTKKTPDSRDLTISIDKDGVRITPTPRVAAPAAASTASAADMPAASAAAASAAAAASSSGVSARLSGNGVEIKLPPGADSDDVREAVEEARAAIIEALAESKQAAHEAGVETAEANRQTARTTRHVHTSGSDDPPLVGLAFLFILASAILKIAYKGTIQAETKAAVATETAESEQLKRQVVEARMAAMQAQVEPHFLFNTLASIDHLIETDPPRASQMQKNLIALLRASMPSMRDAAPMAHNLGREMAVIRPYLEILKVRMEDRLQTRIAVPEGLLSAEFPTMMIQSLVENAIKHGLEPKAEGGELAVSAEIVHGQLAVTIADTGMGFGKADTAGTGTGLANIRERLKLLYGDRASMTVADNSPSGTVVTLTVPYQAQAHAMGTKE